MGIVDILQWLGLGASVIGLILMTVFGVVIPSSEGAVGAWSFRAGVTLLTGGLALAAVAN